MNAHPYAKLFPVMAGDELATLAADIDANGLLEPIVTLDGMILDGRNRFEACGQIGKKPRYEMFTGKPAEALAYVLSKNLHRRHLTESQRAFIAAELANMQMGDNQHAKGGSANLQTHFAPVSQEVAANLLSVSTRSVAAAAVVKDTGIEELKDAVRAGEISVSAAAEVAKLLPRVQRAAVAQGPKAVRRTAAKAKAAKAEKPAASKPDPKVPYPHDDDIPDLPGVYRPRFMRNANGHEVALDALNNPAPDRVGDVFADTRLREVLAACIEATETIEALYQRVGKMKDSPSFPWVNIPTMQDHLKVFRDAAVKFQDHVRAGIPYAVCPKCAGAGTGCKACSMSGYWPKAECDLYPELFRKRGA